MIEDKENIQEITTPIISVKRECEDKIKDASAKLGIALLGGSFQDKVHEIFHGFTHEEVFFAVERVANIVQLPIIAEYKEGGEVKRIKTAFLDKIKALIKNADKN